eukprot:4754360-Ditylum_brightwellii.AAC.1
MKISFWLPCDSEETHVTSMLPLTQGSIPPSQAQDVSEIHWAVSTLSDMWQGLILDVPTFLGLPETKTGTGYIILQHWNFRTNCTRSFYMILHWLSRGTALAGAD